MLRIVAALALLLLPLAAAAADYPGPRTGDWVAPNFKFHTGEVISALKLHYTTVGRSRRHARAGAARQRRLGGEHAHARLRRRNYSVPASRSTRRNITSSFPMPLVTAPAPSRPTGLKTKFPQYDYADMVDAQYRLLSEGLGVRHLRLIIGNSMGGMHAWLWGERYAGLYGRAGADGLAADRDGEPKLDAATDDAGDHPQRSRLQ